MEKIALMFRRILLDCLETRNWRIKLLNENWLNMNKGAAYRKIKRRSNKTYKEFRQSTT
jgi:hypothetical protein